MASNILLLSRFLLLAHWSQFVLLFAACFDNATIHEDVLPNKNNNGTIKQKRSTNANHRFGRWTDRDGANWVRYIISDVYSALEAQTIQNAMYQIESDLDGCVKFKRFHYQYDHGKPHVYFTPTPRRHKDPGMCYSHPGRDLHTPYGEPQEVIVSRAYHAYGCSTSQRGIMGVIANLLGKRDEHRRPDRDYYLHMDEQNLDPKYIFLPFAQHGPYDKYHRNEDVTLMYPYDYCSVTHVYPDYLATKSHYGGDGQRFMFTVRQLPYCIPGRARLSYHDCLALSTLYKCPSYGLCYHLPDCRNVRYITTTAASATSSTTTTTTRAPVISPYGSYYNSDNDVCYGTGFTYATAATTAAVTTPKPPTTTTKPTGRALLPDEINTTPSSSLPEQRLTPPNICSKKFYVDAGTQTADSTIYLFTGKYFYTVDAAATPNVVQGPTLISLAFPDLSIGGPLHDAYTNGNGDLLTHLVDANGVEYTYTNQKFVARLDNDGRGSLKSRATSSFAVTDFGGKRQLYQISADKTNVQHGDTTNTVTTRFPPFTDVDAAASYVASGSGEQLVMVFSGNMVATYRFCDTDNPSSMCFETHQRIRERGLPLGSKGASEWTVSTGQCLAAVRYKVYQVWKQGFGAPGADDFAAQNRRQ